jgi:hypothetical protein
VKTLKRLILGPHHKHECRKSQARGFSTGRSIGRLNYCDELPVVRDYRSCSPVKTFMLGVACPLDGWFAGRGAMPSPPD